MQEGVSCSGCPPIGRTTHSPVVSVLGCSTSLSHHNSSLNTRCARHGSRSLRYSSKQSRSPAPEDLMFYGGQRSCRLLFYTDGVRLTQNRLLVESREAIWDRQLKLVKEGAMWIHKGSILDRGSPVPRRRVQRQKRGASGVFEA